MNAILDIIVPVFGTVAVGWVIGRSKLLSPEGLRGLTNVTFYALFPALLFRSMSKVRLEALSFDILFVFFGAGLLLYLRHAAARPRDGHEAGRCARCSRLSAVFSNGVGIGIPFISYAFGEAGLVPLLMIISMNSLVMLTLSSFLIEVGQQGSSRAGLLGKLGGAVVTMLKHPVIPSIFAGLVLGRSCCAHVPGLGTPVVIDRILQALATAAPPCGLIMAGASLAHVGIKEHWQSAAVATVLQARR